MSEREMDMCERDIMEIEREREIQREVEHIVIHEFQREREFEIELEREIEIDIERELQREVEHIVIHGFQRERELEREIEIDIERELQREVEHIVIHGFQRERELEMELEREIEMDIERELQIEAEHIVIQGFEREREVQMELERQIEINFKRGMEMEIERGFERKLQREIQEQCEREFGEAEREPSEVIKEVVWESYCSLEYLYVSYLNRLIGQYLSHIGLDSESFIARGVVGTIDHKSTPLTRVWTALCALCRGDGAGLPNHDEVIENIRSFLEAAAQHNTEPVDDRIYLSLLNDIIVRYMIKIRFNSNAFIDAALDYMDEDVTLLPIWIQFCRIVCHPLVLHSADAILDRINAYIHGAADGDGNVTGGGAADVIWDAVLDGDGDVVGDGASDVFWDAVLDGDGDVVGDGAADVVWDPGNVVLDEAQVNGVNPLVEHPIPARELALMEVFALFLEMCHLLVLFVAELFMIMCDWVILWFHG